MFFGYYYRNRVTPYVILFIERDGSTYLSSLLMSHPQIKAEYERFAVMKQNGANAREQLKWVDAYLTPPLFGKVAAIGFKTKLVDVLDMDGFSNVLRKKQVHIVQMRRNNLVKAVVSRINARRLFEKSGKWNLYDESDRLSPIEIDLEQFDLYLREREQADINLQAYVDGLQLPSIKIIYEDLLINKNESLRNLFRFIRVQDIAVKGKTLKNTKDDLRDVVLNFDELRRYYAGSKYEPMFDEILVQ